MYKYMCKTRICMHVYTHTHMYIHATHTDRFLRTDPRPSIRLWCDEELVESSRLNWFSKATRERSKEPRDGEELRDLAVLHMLMYV
jgi:hypothetical protein